LFFIVVDKLKIKTVITIIITLITIVFLMCSMLVPKQDKTPIYSNKSKPEYTIVIYLDEKRLYLYENEDSIKVYPIASGKPDWPSPIGYWKIIEKSDWGEGFGGRWLGLNVIWGNYGIHGTLEEYTIGTAASHGCIRMLKKDVKELYDIVPIGTNVIIKNGNFGPFGTGFRDLYPGDRGADVLAVQRRLKILGYFNGKETGIYEDDLKYALHKFQKEKKLKVKNAITLADYHTMGFKEFE
jgi:hypothetical protein